jgi:hypothetical protein
MIYGNRFPKNIIFCYGKFFVEWKSGGWPQEYFYLISILIVMTPHEPPEPGVQHTVCRHMINTPTNCVQNTAYISATIKLIMVLTFETVSDKFKVYRIHTYTTGTPINKYNINTHDENDSAQMIY